MKEAKSSEESSKDGNSTGDKSALILTPVTVASNLTANADPRLVKQLDHVLEEFLLAKGGNHEIRLMFKERDLYQFRDFVACDMQALDEMKRKQHNTTKGFDHRKRTFIYNMIRYYKFLRSDDTTK